MLTQNEKDGFQEILQTFDEDELIALKDTVTNRLVASQNKREAITAILTYTQDALQLLKRRKLKRDAIFQYLHRHHVAILPDADKNKLIRAVLTYWGTDINREANRQLRIEYIVDDDDDEDIPQQVPQHVPHHVPQHVPQGVPQHRPHHVPQHRPQHVPQHVPQGVPQNRPQHVPQHRIQHEPHYEPQHVPQHAPRYVIQDVPQDVRVDRQAGGEGLMIDRNQQNNAAIETTPQVAQQLAKQFVTWFYQQLNSLNPQYASNGADSDWGPHHFFDDCKLKVNIQSKDNRVDQFEGSELVAERFRSMVVTEGLLFNPNTADKGTKGMADPHGLVIVLVCGTVHRQGSCIGVFEQRFGLVRDILNANTWKVKFTDINVKGEAVNQVPTLEGGQNFPALTH